MHTHRRFPRLFESLESRLLLSGISFETGLRVPLANIYRDINNDGKVDILTHQNSSSPWSIEFSLGDGKFTPSQPIVGIPNNESKTTFADFNNDDKIDYLGSSGLYLGVGNGVFQAPVSVAIAGSAILTFGDLNNDDLPDLLYQDSTTFAISARLNNGNATFQNPVATTAGATIASAVIADFDGDGLGDIAFYPGGVRKGNGDGSFQSQITLNLVGTPYVANLNNDSKADLMLVNAGAFGNTVRTYLGDADPTKLLVHNTLFSDKSGFSQAVADFNNDGLDDIAVCDQSTSRTYLNTGGGTFAAGIPLPLSNNGGLALVAVDYNADGNVDLRNTESGSITVGTLCFGNGDGTFLHRQSTTGTTSYGDFNNDGRPDMIVGSSGLHSYAVRLMNPDGSFQPDSPAATFAGVGYISKTGDFNGDHNLDLIVFQYTPYQYSVFLGNGDGTFQTAINAPLTTSMLEVKVGDVNNDGRDDVFATAFNLDVYLGSANGSLTLKNSYEDFGCLGFADFNGDGKIDLANSAGYYPGDGTGNFAATVPLFAAGRLAAVGDFNGDGRRDVAIFIDVFGGDESLRIYIAAANNVLQLQHTYTGVFYDSSDMQTADFNGDSVLDLALASADPFGRLAILRGLGDGSFELPKNFAINYGPMAIVDFNQDGKPDVISGDSSRAIVFNNSIRLDTTTVISPSQTDVDYGESVSFTANVTASDGHILTGSVQFFVDNLSFGPAAPLVGGFATSNLIALAAGDHTIRAEFTSSNSDYDDSTSSLVQTVDKLPLTASADSKTKAYAQSNPALTGTFTGALAADGITISYATSAAKFSHPGDYAITPILLDPNNKLQNYDVTLTPGTLHVEKANQIINWATPADIFDGDPLTKKQLNAKAIKPVGGTPNGIFTYDHDLGEFLVAGDHLLTVTAAATQDYNETSASVTIHVKEFGPDLKVSLGKFSPGSIIRPGETLKIPITVQNVGNQKVDASKVLPIEVLVYNSDDDQFDPGDPLLVPSFFITAPLAPNAKKVFAATIKIPADYIPGSFFVNADINDPNVGADPDVENNHLPTNVEFKVDNMFGKIPNRTPLASFTGVEDDGTKFTFTLSGPGYGTVAKQGGNFGILLEGTTAATSLTITAVKSKTPGDDGLITLEYLSVLGPNGFGDSAMNSIKARTTRLKGLDVVTIKTLSIHSVPAGGVLHAVAGSVSIAGNIESATIDMGAVGKFTVGGNITNSFVAMSNPHEPGPALGAFTAKQIINSEFRFYGQVTSFKADLFQNSYIYAAFAGNFGGFPPTPADWFNNSDRQRIDNLIIGTFASSCCTEVELSPLSRSRSVTIATGLYPEDGTLNDVGKGT